MIPERTRASGNLPPNHSALSGGPGLPDSDRVRSLTPKEGSHQLKGGLGAAAEGEGLIQRRANLPGHLGGFSWEPGNFVGFPVCTVLTWPRVNRP